MGGKAAILLVLGFSLIFLVVGYNSNRLSLNAVDNYTKYYKESVVHNIATSGANIAANKIFMDPTWSAGFQNLDYQGGTIDVKVDILDAFKNIRQITAIGTYSDETHTIQVILRPSRFSKFAYYSEIEGNIWWTTSDTVWGPVHIQDYLRVHGHPVFKGKVTIQKRIDKYDRWSDPILLGGFEDGINLNLPPDKVKDLEVDADTDGYKFEGHNDVYLQFKGDSLTYKFSEHGAETTVLVSNFSPNGIIYVKSGNLHVKGVVKGQYSVAAWGSSSGKGRIYIDDDIVYNTNPKTDPSSTDILGIIARNEVFVTNNAANRNNINIYGSIYSEKEGFGAEDYDSRPVSGSINLYGGIVQKKRQPVGTFNSRTGQTSSGFLKNYKYDERLMYTTPPSYPATNSFEVVSWYE